MTLLRYSRLREGRIENFKVQRNNKLKSFYWSTHTDSAVSCTPLSQHCRTLWSNIYWRNRNLIRKYVSRLISTHSLESDFKKRERELTDDSEVDEWVPCGRRLEVHAAPVDTLLPLLYTRHSVGTRVTLGEQWAIRGTRGQLTYHAANQRLTRGRLTKQCIHC